MAKVSMVERERKREKLVRKYAEKRKALKAIIANPDTPDEERMDAQAEAAGNAPRRQPGAPAQSLPPDRAPARRISQVRPRP